MTASMNLRLQRTVRIAFLFLLALIVSVFMGFGGYIMSTSLFPPIQNRCLSIAVFSLCTFLFVFPLLLYMNKYRSSRHH